jgi:hypothetical protein
MSNLYSTGHMVIVRIATNGDLHWSVVDTVNGKQVSVNPHTDKFGKNTKRGVLLQSLCTDHNRVHSKPPQHHIPLDDYLALCDEQPTYVRPFPQPLTWG